jgi:aldehyde:ferredoxin oxidoreductase
MAYTFERKILHVDLTKRKIWNEVISREMTAAWLGGRGINMKILWDNVKAGTDPLGPDSIVIFGAGFLNGTVAPSAGRTCVTFKSPATNLYSKSSGGGWWGASLKFAGYDHIVLSGISEEPVYLWIDNEKVEIRDADHLWGKTVTETNEILKYELGHPDVEIASIGPGGENLVKMAAIMLSISSAMGRTGGGAVMGSKKLKAIAVRGTGVIENNDNEKFYKVALESRRALTEDSGAFDLYVHGTAGLVSGVAASGTMPSYNFRLGSVEGIENLTGQSLNEKGILKTRIGCAGCAIHCHRYSEIREGKYEGYRAAGPEYETISAFGSGCGITDMNAVVRGSGLCNDYGMDTISVGNVIQWTIDSIERGVLTKEEVDGFDLRWNNSEAVLEMVKKIAFREGFGDVLAEGVKIASEKIGRGSEKWAIQARGLEQSNVETRSAKGYALAFSINPRGPDHLMNAAIMEFGLTQESRDLVKKLTGDEKYATPYTTEKRANIIRWGEDCIAVSDCLGVCMFASATAWSINPEVMAQLFSANTGIAVSEKEIMSIGRKIVTLERAFNIREGHGRKNDTLPYMLMHEKVPEGPQKGFVNSQEELDVMLDDYYTKHEWDLKTGWPTEKTYKKLGLDFVIDELKSMGKIPG